LKSSAALFVAVAALAALSLLAAPIASEIIFLAGNGTQKIQYGEGTEPVVMIKIDLPTQVAQAIKQVNATGWTASIMGNTLTISGGTLLPGQSIDLSYKITKYVAPGTVNAPATFYTARGQSFPGTGNLAVSEIMYLYQLFQWFGMLAVPFLLLMVPAFVFWKKDWLKLKLKPEKPKPNPQETTVKLDIPDIDWKKLTEPTPPTPPPKFLDQPMIVIDYDKIDTTYDGKNIKLGISITKCPKKWMPEGVGRVQFLARLYYWQDGKWNFPVTKAGERKIKFLLHDVSNEAGVCLNFGDADAADLWFDNPKANRDFVFPSEAPSFHGTCPGEISGEENPSHRHFDHVETKTRVKEATVTVRSEDFGAWGWIEAKSEEDVVQLPPLENSWSPLPYENILGCIGAGKEGKPEWWVKIPRDDNGNSIADCAEQDKGKNGQPSKPESDDDAVPEGNKKNGDGLTVYEEYRGFLVNDPPTVGNKEFKPRHVRTDINQKDVFVFVENKNAQLLDAVWNGYFRETGLGVHVISDERYLRPNGEPESRIINRNHGSFHGGAQHAIWLRAWEVAAYGVACPQDKVQAKALEEKIKNNEKVEAYVTPGTPIMINHVCINMGKCSKKERLYQIVAHELAHAVNISHHGELIDKETGHTHKDHSGLYYMQGKPNSGAQNCVMRNDVLGDGWCSIKPDVMDKLKQALAEGKITNAEYDQVLVNPNSHVVHRTYVDKNGKRIPLGTTFCDTERGTGANDYEGARNDAAEGKGNCRNRIKVKDW
jgi:hypothetical protein